MRQGKPQHTTVGHLKTLAVTQARKVAGTRGIGRGRLNANAIQRLKQPLLHTLSHGAHKHFGKREGMNHKVVLAVQNIEGPLRMGIPRAKMCNEDARVEDNHAGHSSRRSSRYPWG